MARNYFLVQKARHLVLVTSVTTKQKNITRQYCLKTCRYGKIWHPSKVHNEMRLWSGHVINFFTGLYLLLSCNNFFFLKLGDKIPVSFLQTTTWIRTYGISLCGFLHSWPIKAGSNPRSLCYGEYEIQWHSLLLFRQVFNRGIKSSKKNTL